MISLTPAIAYQNSYKIPHLPFSSKTPPELFLQWFLPRFLPQIIVSCQMALYGQPLLLMKSSHPSRPTSKETSKKFPGGAPASSMPGRPVSVSSDNPGLSHHSRLLSPKLVSLEALIYKQLSPATVICIHQAHHRTLNLKCKGKSSLSPSALVGPCPNVPHTHTIKMHWQGWSFPKTQKCAPK